jgi:hypothetical protein
MSQYFAGSIQPGRTFLFLDFFRVIKFSKTLKFGDKDFSKIEAGFLLISICQVESILSLSIKI